MNKEYKVFDTLDDIGDEILNLEDVIEYYEGILSKYEDKYEELTLCGSRVLGLRLANEDEALIQKLSKERDNLSKELHDMSYRNIRSKHSILDINQVGDEV